jgi:hypothetical protein
MGNIPTNQGNQGDQGDQGELEAVKPHKLSLETEIDGKNVSASLTCTRNGAILACDSELWFQTKGKLVALSALTERVTERVTDRVTDRAARSAEEHQEEGEEEEEEEGEEGGWLQFELFPSHPFATHVVTSRADVGRNIQGVAKITGNQNLKIRFDRETGSFALSQAGWYIFKAEAWGKVDFIVEDANNKVLVRGGNPVWRLIHVDSPETLSVNVTAREADFLSVPGFVLVALRYHAAFLPQETFTIGKDFELSTRKGSQDSDTQSDLSID